MAIRKTAQKDEWGANDSMLVYRHRSQVNRAMQALL